MPRPIRQDSWYHRWLDRALPAGNDRVCFRVDHDARVIRSRTGDVPFDRIQRIWVRTARQRLLFGDRDRVEMVLNTSVGSFAVLKISDRDDAERIIADLGLDVPVERYVVIEDQRSSG